MKPKAYHILFESDSLLAVNKASGLFTIPDRQQQEPSLKELLTERYGSVFTVHRIDRDTSGLVLFARNEETHRHLSMQFEHRKVLKWYVGIVHGCPTPPTGLIDAPIQENPQRKGSMMIHRNGKSSQTSYTILQSNPHFSLVEFQLHTGRTHQIRVHAKQLGHPLACDPIYGDEKPVFLSDYKKKFKQSKWDEERPMIQRLALHAYRLSFIDSQHNSHTITANIPKEFTALMTQLNK
ncbi:MAG: RluA family pseudouridine synthase [Ferruginibacter sp.]